jgi:ABC-type branched-subunit amino acid transport system substrate-binding protein
VQHSAQVAVQMINDAGGAQALHRKFTLGTYDTQSQVSVAKTAAQRAISDGCKALIGTSSSDESLRVAQVANRAEVPLFIVNSVDQKTGTTGDKWVYKLNPVGSTWGPKLSKAAKYVCGVQNVAPGHCTVSITYLNVAYGKSVSQAMKKTAPANGIQIVGRHEYGLNQGNLRSVALAVKADNAAVTWDIGYGPSAASLAKAFSAVGGHQKAAFFVGMDAHSVNALGAKANNTYGHSWWSPDEQIPNQALLNNFLKRYKKEYPNVPLQIDSGLAGYNYTVVEILSKAMSKCKCTSGAHLRSALAGVRLTHNAKPPFGLMLPQKVFQFSPYKPAGQVSQLNKNSAEVLEQVQNQKLVPVWPTEFAARKAISQRPGWEK